MNPNTIDDLLHNLHNDKLVRFEDQLTSLEREINTRRLIGAETHVRLFEQIQELTDQINRLLPENPMVADLHQRDREGLERERRTLDRDLVEELRNRWRDVQELKREQRLVRDQQHQAWQQYERHTKHYDS